MRNFLPLSVLIVIALVCYSFLPSEPKMLTVVFLLVFLFSVVLYFAISRSFNLEDLVVGGEGQSVTKDYVLSLGPGAVLLLVFTFVAYVFL